MEEREDLDVVFGMVVEFEGVLDDLGFSGAMIAICVFYERKI